MVNVNYQTIIREALAGLKSPVRVAVFTSDAHAEDIPHARAVAQELKAASPKIALEFYDIIMDRDKSGEYGVTRVPTFVVEGSGHRKVSFSGKAEGLTLVLMLDVITALADGKAWFPEGVASTVNLLQKDVAATVLLENDCTLCKPVAETAIGLALTNRHVFAEIVVADQYPEILSKHRVKILPFTIFGSRLTLEGHVGEGEFLEMIFRAEGEKAAGLDKRCLVCGSASPDVICTSCKSRIQSEAVSHKKKDEHLNQAGTVVKPRKNT